MTQSSKKALQFAIFIVLDIIAFVLLYLISAYFLSRIVVNSKVKSVPEMSIYIKSNGVHTDLVLPIVSEQKIWNQDFPFANTKITDSLNYQFVALGWGDKGFYLETPTWNDLTIRVALRAALGLSSTAMHVTYYKAMEEGVHCKKINISKQQYAKLIAYIDKSIKKQADNTKPSVIKTNANYGIADAFYDAKGSYSILYTCNTWANNGLKAAEQKACLWTPFDTGIFLKYP